MVLPTYAELIVNPYFLFFVGFLGMITHFLKSYQAKQIPVCEKGVCSTLWKYFFKEDVINTILTVIAYIITFFIMYGMEAQTVFSMFSAGYMSDSLFNRAGEKGIGALK